MEVKVCWRDEMSKISERESMSLTTYSLPEPNLKLHPLILIHFPEFYRQFQTLASPFFKS